MICFWFHKLFSSFHGLRAEYCQFQLKFEQNRGYRHRRASYNKALKFQNKGLKLLIFCRFAPTVRKPFKPPDIYIYADIWKWFGVTKNKRKRYKKEGTSAQQQFSVQFDLLQDDGDFKTNNYCHWSFSIFYEQIDNYSVIYSGNRIQLCWAIASSFMYLKCFVMSAI